MDKLGIIADDLTGALDTGLQFSKKGLLTLVLLAEDVAPEADVAVINTDSRADPPQIAARKAREAARRLRGRIIYKKIDSTLRGNVGAELIAVIDELGLTKAVVAPAFPANGRTTVGGRQLVHGVPLEETAFARDPRCAVAESHIPTLLQAQTGRRVGHADLALVSQGPLALKKALEAGMEAIWAADAVDGGHLRFIAGAIALAGPDWLACGSAGLAEELPAALGWRSREREFAPPEPADRPVLVVSGSRHEATAEQLKEANSVLGLPLLEPDPYRMVDEAAGAEEFDRLRREADLYLQQGQSLIVTSTFSPFVPGGSQQMASALGALVRGIVNRWQLAGLFLTGGDIAVEACRALRAGAIRVEGEVAPGIPASRLVGGEHEGLRLVTKAGGFGQLDAIVRSVRYLRGEQDM